LSFLLPAKKSLATVYKPILQSTLITSEVPFVEVVDWPAKVAEDFAWEVQRSPFPSVMVQVR
jgi:hypothetical protein